MSPEERIQALLAAAPQILQGGAVALSTLMANDAWWGDVDEVIPALLDGYGNLSPADDAYASHQAVLIRALRYTIAATKDRASFSMRLCAAMFLSELATSTSDLILSEVVQCSETLILATLRTVADIDAGASGLMVVDASDKELASTLLGELDGLRTMLGSVLRQQSSDAAATSAASLFNANRHVVAMMRNVATMLLQTTTGCVLQQKEVGAQPGRVLSESYAVRVVEETTRAVLSVLSSTAHVASLASMAVYAVDGVLRLIAAQEVLHASVGHGLLAEVCLLIRKTLESETNASGSIISVPSVSRPLRRLISESLDARFPTLPAAGRQALEAALETIGGRAADIVHPPAAPAHDAAASTPLDIASWNQMFRRAAVTRRVADGVGAAFPMADGGGTQDPNRDNGGIDDGEGAIGAYGHLSAFDHGLRGVEEPLTLQDLVEMVFRSLRSMPIDVVSEDGHLERRHVEGIRQSEFHAACLAQREELARLQRQEAQSIEDVPAGKLMERSGRGAAALREAGQALERSSMRATLQKKTFLALLKSFQILRKSASSESVGGLSEAKIRSVHALVARTLTQLPDAVSDAATDGVLELLQEELEHPSPPKQLHGSSLLQSLTSVFSLILQILYMKYVSTAPYQLQGQLLISATASAATFGAAIGGSGPALLHGATGDATSTIIHVDNPIGWLSAGKMESSADVDQHRQEKRPRHEQSSATSNAASSFDFTLDTAEQPTAYSHFLRRALTVAVDANRVDAVISLLLQCPAITANIWAYLLQRLCLGERAQCPIGVFAVSHIAAKRPVYRDQAVSVLLHLAGCHKVDPRRLAVAQLAKLLDGGATSSDNDGQRTTMDAMAHVLVQYAGKLIARVPLIRPTKGEGLQQHVVGGADVVTDALEERERQHVLAAVDRHLGLHLMLCSRRALLKGRGGTSSLIASLFTTFEECYRQGNAVVQAVLLEHPDVSKLIQQLFSDASDFLLHVVPILRRHAKQGAERLVHRVLSVVSHEIRTHATVLRTSATVAPSSAVEAEMENLISVASALYSQASLLFQESRLALSAGSSGREVTTYVRDIRFLAPFLSLMPRSELRAPAEPLIGLLQFASTDAFEESDVRAALKEVFVKFPLPFTDGQPRGMSPSELLMFVHEAAQPTVASSEGSVAPTGLRPLVTEAMFKCVASICLSLTRNFERLGTQTGGMGAPAAAAAPLLFDVKDCHKILQQLLRVKPIPSLMMYTAVLCCRNHGDDRDLLSFIVSGVLPHLARESIWDVDAVLWRGVQQFCDDHWHETNGFLFNLPDRVLVGTLKEHPRMRETFLATQSTNASFAHIISAL